MDLKNDGSVSFASIGTTGSANAYLDAASPLANQLLRVSSGRRYKTDIERYLPEAARALVKELRPVGYRSLCEADDPRRNSIGLIAEDVAEVCPELVTFNRNGRPESVHLAVLPLAAMA